MNTDEIEQVLLEMARILKNIGAAIHNLELRLSKLEDSAPTQDESEDHEADNAAIEQLLRPIAIDTPKNGADRSQVLLVEDQPQELPRELQQVQEARKTGLPIFTGKEYDLLIAMREAVDQGIATDDPDRMKQSLRQLDELITQCLSGFQIDYPIRVDAPAPAGDSYFGLESLLVRVLKVLGVGNEEIRWQMAKKLALMVEEYESAEQDFR